MGNAIKLSYFFIFFYARLMFPGILLVMSFTIISVFGGSIKDEDKSSIISYIQNSNNFSLNSSFSLNNIIN